MAVKARKRTKNRVAATDHSELVLGILYRVGGATVDQVAALMRHADPERWAQHSAAYEAAKKTCRVLRENGMAEAVSLRRPWVGRTEGRPESFYRLRRGGEGQVEGAIAAGAPGAKAAVNYRRIWSGGGVAHAAMRVDYVLALLDGAEDAGAYVDPESAWAESCPAYPLVGSRLSPQDAAGKAIKAKATARRIYERVVPDGEAEVEFAGGAPCPLYFEIERRTQTAVVAEKIERYAGRWLRVLKDDGVLEARPVIVVHHDARRAGRTNPRAGAGAPAMARALEDVLYSGQGQGHFAALQTELLRRDEYAALGRMILVCGWEDVAAHGAHASVYHPVSAYEDGDDVVPVDLRAAAEERAELVRGFAGSGS